MEQFKGGLNQFWVGAVFGLCLAISLVLIPVAIIMSNINDVLKIHEVSVLVAQVSTAFEKSERAISNAKTALIDFDNDVVMDTLTAVQAYHQQSQPVLTAKQRQTLKAQIKEQLVMQLESKLNEQQITFILSVFEKLADTKKGAQTLPN